MKFSYMCVNLCGTPQAEYRSVASPQRHSLLLLLMVTPASNLAASDLSSMTISLFFETHINGTYST